MAAPDASPAEMISQLEAARKLALADASVYSQVVPGVLPLIGPAAALDVRRWGADFLAECFSSPNFASASKELLVADTVTTLRAWLENPGEDLAVLRSAIQCASSLYAAAFKRMYVPYTMNMNHVPYLSCSTQPMLLCFDEVFSDMLTLDAPTLTKRQYGRPCWQSNSTCYNAWTTARFPSR
jgi:hypothetical protein